jgi:L-asparaginase type II
MGVLRVGFVGAAMVGAALALAPAAATAQEEDRPIIKIVATGGTIANSPDGRLSVDAVIEALPMVEDLAMLRTEEVTRVGSSTLGWQEFVDTAKAIERSLAEEPEIDGYVVTIGSNTSEDMAYFLNLVLDTEKPVVVTAAQRQRTTLSEDASRNFVDAVITAGTPESAGKGVVLVANELIHAGRDVVKQVVSRVDSWQSLDVGALGIVSGGEAIYYREPTRRHTIASEFSLDEIDSAEDLPQVEILYSYVDASPTMIDALVTDGVDGLVVAAFATGSAHAGQRPPLAAAMDQGVKVAIANRGSNGRFTVEDGDYYDLSADNLAPQKALILMMMGLTVTDDSAELRRIFREY